MRRGGPVKRNHPLYCTDCKSAIIESADCYFVGQIKDDNLQKEFTNLYHVLLQMSTKPLALRGQKSLVQYAIYKGKPSHVGTLLEKGQVFFFIFFLINDNFCSVWIRLVKTFLRYFSMTVLMMNLVLRKGKSACSG